MPQVTQVTDFEVFSVLQVLSVSLWCFAPCMKWSLLSFCCLVSSLSTSKGMQMSQLLRFAISLAPLSLFSSLTLLLLSSLLVSDEFLPFSLLLLLLFLSFMPLFHVSFPCPSPLVYNEMKGDGKKEKGENRLLPSPSVIASLFTFLPLASVVSLFFLVWCHMIHPVILSLSWRSFSPFGRLFYLLSSRTFLYWLINAREDDKKPFVFIAVSSSPTSSF